MKIWLLRHAQSEWNAAGRWQGHGDPPLSESGRARVSERAPSVVAELRGGRPIAFFCSDLLRAVETAGLLSPAIGVPATPVPGLRELDVGSWTGLTRSEIEARDPATLAAFDSLDPDVRPGGGESRRELGVRVRRALEGLAGARPDSDLLLVVHLGVVRTLVPGAEPDHLELRWTDLDAVRRETSPASARR